MGLEDAKRNIEQLFASLEEAEEKDKSGLLKKGLEEHEDLFYEVEDLVDLGGFLNLQTKESKQYYEEGLKEVESTMYELAAEGQDILKGKENKKDKFESFDSLASELDRTLNKYKPTVEKLSRIDAQVNDELEAAEERMIAIEKIEKKQLENDLDFDEETYEIYIDEAIDSFATILKLYNTIGNLPEAFREKKKEIESNVKQLAKKEIVVKQKRLIRDKYGSLVEMEYDYDNRDDGSYEIVGGEIIPKEEFYALSFLDQRKLIVDLRSIEFEVADKVDEKIAPTKAESFYEGRKLYEQGKYQEAKIVLELFIKDADSWNTLEDGNPPSNLDELVRTAGEYLDEINESLGKQVAIINAQELIDRDDLHGAKKVLKKFIEEGVDTSDEELKRNIEAARKLLKRIELTVAERTLERLYEMRPPKKVVTTVRAGERTVINPQYKEWHTYYQAARDVYSAIKEGKHNDFSSAYDEVLKNKGQYYYQEGTRKSYEFEKDNRFNVLEDEKMLDNLPHGYLELARKYRKVKQYDLAEQYFLAYFEKDLVKVAQERLTFEQYKKKVDSDVGFNKELADIVAENKKLFEEEAAEKGYDPSSFNEAEIREKALLMLYQKKLPEVAVAEKQSLHQAHPDSFNAYDKEVWSEFMDMKGQTWEGSPLELFDMSDADWDWLKYQLAIDIGMIAISGFGGSLLKKGTGFALAKIRDNTLRRKMVQELAEAGSMEAREQIITKYRFMQEAELALGKGIGQSAYTRGAGTLAGVSGGTAIESFGFSVSHATLNGLKNGRFNVLEEVNANWQHDMKVFAILGASGRVSHSLLDKFLISKNPVLKTAGGLGTLGIEANAMALANGGQLTKHDVAMILGFRVKRLGIDKGKRAIDYLRESNTENLKAAEIGGNKETASALGVSDIYFGKFGENLEVGGKPAEGFMDASSRRIHYNMTYLNEGNLAPHLVEKGVKEKIMPDGYKLENTKGETVVKGPKGDMSLHEFFKLPEGNNLMTALRNTATHEKTQRYIHKKSGKEVVLEDGRKILVEDSAKTESVKSLFTVAGETGKIKLELPDGRKLTDKSKVTWLDIEEFIAHVADGSKKLSEFEKAKLLKEIKKFAPEFEWDKGRQLDTKELTAEGAETIGRERAAARIVAEAPPLEAEKTPRPKSPDSGVRLKGEIDWQKGVTFEDLKKAAEGGKDQAIAKKILYDLISISKIKDPELRKQTVESLVKKYGIKDRMELYTLLQQVGSEVSKQNDVVAEGLSKSRKQKQPSLYLETELDAFGRELARSIISESKRVETILIDGDPSKLMKAIQTGIVTVNKETLGKLVASDKGWKMMREIMENNPQQQRLFNAELKKMDLSQAAVNADSLVYIAMQKNAPEVIWGLVQEGKIKELKEIPEAIQTELFSTKEGVKMLENMMMAGAVKSLNELSLPAKMSLTNSPEGIEMIRDSLRVGDIKGFEKMPDALKLRLADTEGGYQLILDLMAKREIASFEKLPAELQSRLTTNESIAHINKLIEKRKINPADVPAPVLEALSTHESGLKTIRSLLEAGQIKSVKDLPEAVRGNLELDFVSSFEKRINGTIDAEIKKIKERIKELEEPGRNDHDLKEKLEDARKLLEAYEYVRNKEIFEWQSRIADMETQKVPEGYESLPSVLDVLLVHGHKLAPEYVHGMLKGKAAYETVFDGKGERKIMYFDGKYLGVGGIAITQQTLVVAEGLKEPVVFASKTPKAKNDLVEKIDKLEKELAQVKEAGFAQEALQSYETRINLFKEIHELYKEYSKLEYCDDATYIDYAGRLNSLYAKHIKSGAYEAYGYQPYSELFAYGREGINESHNARKILAIQAKGGLDLVIRNKYVGQGSNITFMEALNHPKLDGKVVGLNELMDPQFKLDGKKKISTEQYWMYVVDLLETSGTMNDTYGLVHRDLKPENVLIAPDGKLRIIDLGSIRTKKQLESIMFPATAPSEGAFPSLGGVTATFIDTVKSYHEAKGTKGPDGKPLAKFGYSDRFSNSQIISESIDYRVAGLMPDQIIALEQVREYLKEPDASSNVAAERIRNVFENY